VKPPVNTRSVYIHLDRFERWFAGQADAEGGAWL
jgi:hypothetical protein